MDTRVPLEGSGGAPWSESGSCRALLLGELSNLHTSGPWGCKQGFGIPAGGWGRVLRALELPKGVRRKVQVGGV